MERYFYRLGKKITVSEVEGVVAAKFSLDEDRRAIVHHRRFGTLATRRSGDRPYIKLDKEERKLAVISIIIGIVLLVGVVAYLFIRGG